MVEEHLVLASEVTEEGMTACVMHVHARARTHERIADVCACVVERPI